jgi:CDP-diglyceride synthetase
MSLVAALLGATAEEGRNIILSMLVVGLVFLVIIVLGDINAYFAKKRRYRKAARRSY